MRIFILEDENLAAEQLQQFIRRYDPNITIAGWKKKVSDGLEWLQNNPAPDLIFSDIELLDGNAFQLFEQINISTPIIFATAYDQYLLKAFQANGIAYLLKPYQYEQFAEALSKYKRLIPPEGISARAIADLKQALQPSFQQYRSRFTIKKTSGIFLLQAEEISYFQADDKLVFAFTPQGKRHSLNHTLTELEQQLNPTHFFRINRSEIVQLTHILKLESFGKDRLAIHLKGSNKPLVSSAGKTPALRQWLDG